MSRHYRTHIARVLLAAFLFAQGAVSVYACPGPGEEPIAVAATASMPDCDGMTGLDPAVPNLCLAHCQSGQMTVDQSAHPIPPAALLGAIVVSLPDPVAAQGLTRTSNTMRFTAAAPPPHTILHCCFRI